MRLTLELWGSDYRRLREVARCAEDCGFDGLFYGESLTDLDLDCWTVLAGLAEVTRRLRLGPVITNILPGYRSIALLAKQAVTLQDISAGRLEFRTGAGATVELASPWWAPYGVAYPPHGQRLAALAEGLRALIALWAGESPPRDGCHFALPRRGMRAPDAPIAVTIAARHEESMRLAGELAATWETSYVSPQEFRALDAKFSALAGPRSPAILRSVEVDLVIAATRRNLDAKLARFAAERRGTGIQRLVRTGLIGLPEEVAERAAAFAAAGVDQLVIAPLEPFDTDALRLLARTLGRW